VPYAYTRDYEELYGEYKKNNMGVESLVDGEENQKGYYMEDLPW